MRIRRWRGVLSVGGSLVVLAGILVWQQQQQTHFDPGQSEQLITAITNHDLNAVRQALAHGADPNYAPPVPRSSVATVFLYVRSFCFWNPPISHGAIRALSQHQETPLAQAVRQGQSDTVATLLAKGASVNQPTDNGFTPLMIAVNSTDRSDRAVSLAEQLLGAGANPNRKSKEPAILLYPLSPLDIAVSSKNAVPMARLLLKYGAIPSENETKLRLSLLQIRWNNTAK